MPVFTIERMDSRPCDWGKAVVKFKTQAAAEDFLAILCLDIEGATMQDATILNLPTGASYYVVSKALIIPGEEGYRETVADKRKVFAGYAAGGPLTTDGFLPGEAVWLKEMDRDPLVPQPR